MSLMCCARFAVVFFNVWFAIIGFVLLAVGGVVKFGFDFILNFAQPVLQPLMSSLPIANATSSAQNGITGLLDQLGLLKIVNDLAITLIIVGLFLFVIGCLGCCGACCKVKCMLICYAIFLGLVILGQIGAIIFYYAYQPQASTAIKNGLNATIKTQYGGIQSFDGISLGYNFAMYHFKCCGIDDYRDFYHASKWKRNYTTTYGSENVTLTLATPVVCCKLQGDFPSSMTPVDKNCTFDPTTANSNYLTGCYKAVGDYVGNYLLYCIGALGGTAFLEILLFIFAIIILVKNNKVEPE